VTLHRKYPGALTFENWYQDPFFNDPGSLRSRMQQDMGGMGIYRYRCVYLYMCQHLYTYTYTYTYTYYAYRYKYIYINIYIHVYVYIRTYIRTYIHPYTHTYTYRHLWHGDGGQLIGLQHELRRTRRRRPELFLLKVQIFKKYKKIEAGGGGCKSYFFLLLVRIFKSQWPITYCLYIVTIFRRACT
jgi:hypothetical protein